MRMSGFARKDCRCATQCWSGSAPATSDSDDGTRDDCGDDSVVARVRRGSQMLQPLAIAVIGGIMASMVLSLIVTPAVHYYLSGHKDDKIAA